MKNHKSCYSSTSANPAVSCDSAGKVVVHGLLAMVFLHLRHKPFSLPLLSDYAMRILGQELTLVFCAMFYMADLGCSCLSHCVVIKIMALCLGGGGKEMIKGLIKFSLRSCLVNVCLYQYKPLFQRLTLLFAHMEDSLLAFLSPHFFFLCSTTYQSICVIFFTLCFPLL